MNLRIVSAEPPPALTASPEERAELRALERLADAAEHARRRYDDARNAGERRERADAYRDALARFRRFARFASAEVCFGTDYPKRPCTATVPAFGERCPDCAGR